jgi:hypothetical protein
MAACVNVINASSAAMFLASTMIAYSNDLSLTVTHELRETTNKDSEGWANYMEGKRSWETSVAGWYASDDTTVGTLLNDSIITRAQAEIQIKAHDTIPADVTASGGAMNKTFTGNAWVENVTVNFNGNGSNADFSASLRGCSALTYA